MIDLNSIILIIIVVAITLSIIRLITTQDTYTKVLMVNLIGTKIIFLLLIVSVLFMKRDFTDVAFVYALINFITTISLSNFLEKEE